MVYVIKCPVCIINNITNGTLMTNPTNKYSLEEYHSKVKNNCPDILDVIGYTGVDNPVTLVCKHGETLTNGYSALHRKHCCKTSYYESKKRPLDSSVIIQNLFLVYLLQQVRKFLPHMGFLMESHLACDSRIFQDIK